VIPLSYAQRRLWFLNRLEGASSAYNVPLVLRLDGVPDSSALAAALADVVGRHEVLRTVFPSVDGEPYQHVLDGVDKLLTVETCAAQAVDALVAAFAQEPFDLCVDAPIRARLYVAGARESVLILLLHHVATDGRSTGPLLRDLSAAYEARLDGGAPAWEPLPVQYADFTLWQRELLGEPEDPDSDLSQHLTYWRKTLDGSPAQLDLPTDRPRPTEPAHTGGVVVGRLDRTSHQRLTDLARTRQASVFMVLQAALALALSRTGAGEDIPIGTAVAGRFSEETLDDVVGFFTNTLVLRADVSGDPTPIELVDRIRNTALNAYQHEDLPFDVLVEQLNPDRSLAVHPFFQVMLTLDDAAGPGLFLGNLAARLEPAKLDSAKFDLSVFATQIRDEAGDPAGIEVWFQYAAELFDEETAQLLTDVYIRTLKLIAADPATRLAQADLVTPEQSAGLAARRARMTEDRHQSSATADQALEAEAEAAAHRISLTPRQEILCGLFAETLGRDAVDPADNFFRIGGHSLLATKLANRIRTALGVEIGIRDLFLAPTVTGLDQRIREQDSAAAARPVLSPAARPDRIPLSYAQRRLWFVNQLEGPSHSYNVPLVLRLDRPLDAAVLSRALSDLAARHESLRTIFTAHDGEPFQTILADAKPELVMVTTTADLLQAQIKAATSHIFDLATQIPLRAWLIDAEEASTNTESVAETSQVLVLLVHHIAADGWSMTTLLNDLNTAYAARARSMVPQWAALPVQYADYALWQHAMLGDAADSDSAMAEATTFWRAALNGAPLLLDLPTDRPRPATPTHRGDLVTFALSAHTHQALADLARHSGATLFMVLQAAFATLLQRLGAGTDLPIGTAVSGREDQALDGLVGFFVNTLVMRTDTSGNPTFAELVRRVRETDLAAYGHQHLPFDQLVEQLNPYRTASHHPFVQVMLMLHNHVAPAPAGLPLTGEDLPFDTGTAKFDLTLALRELRDESGAAQGLAGVLEYAADLFDHSTAARFTELLTRILDAVATDPALAIGEIEVLSDEERQTLLAMNTSAGAGNVSYVLDSQLQLVPVGVPGDLYIAQPDTADGLSIGLAESAATFSDNPFGPPGSRLLRTGDRARWVRDGNRLAIELCDERIEICGIRVDPAPIEAVLATQATVASAAVALAPHESADAQLVAYIVPQPGAPVDEAELLGAVAAALPEYAVPAAVVILDSMPLTPEGRIDRAALATAHRVSVGTSGSSSSGSPGGERSANALEQLLCSLIREVLSGREAGADDNFFRIGGHSLLAVRLVGRIRAELGVELSLRDVFQTPTAAGLARRIQAAQPRPSAATGTGAGTGTGTGGGNGQDSGSGSAGRSRTVGSAPTPENRPTLRRRTQAGAVVRSSVDAAV